MTATQEQPRFTVWLGEGWPGLYLVEAKDAKGGLICRVGIEGVSDQAEALNRVVESFPEIQNNGYSISITLAHFIQADGTVVPPRPEPVTI